MSRALGKREGGRRRDHFSIKWSFLPWGLGQGTSRPHDAIRDMLLMLVVVVAVVVLVDGGTV